MMLPLTPRGLGSPGQQPEEEQSCRHRTSATSHRSSATHSHRPEVTGTGSARRDSWQARHEPELGTLRSDLAEARLTIDEVVKQLRCSTADFSNVGDRFHVDDKELLEGGGLSLQVEGLRNEAESQTRQLKSDHSALRAQLEQNEPRVNAMEVALRSLRAELAALRERQEMQAAAMMEEQRSQTNTINMLLRQHSQHQLEAAALLDRLDAVERRDLADREGDGRRSKTHLASPATGSEEDDGNTRLARLVGEMDAGLRVEFTTRVQKLSAELQNELKARLTQQATTSDARVESIENALKTEINRVVGDLRAQVETELRRLSSDVRSRLEVAEPAPKSAPRSEGQEARRRGSTTSPAQSPRRASSPAVRLPSPTLRPVQGASRPASKPASYAAPAAPASSRGPSQTPTLGSPGMSERPRSPLRSPLMMERAVSAHVMSPSIRSRPSQSTSSRQAAMPMQVSVVPLVSPADVAHAPTRELNASPVLTGAESVPSPTPSPVTWIGGNLPRGSSVSAAPGARPASVTPTPVTRMRSAEPSYVVHPTVVQQQGPAKQWPQGGPSLARAPSLWDAHWMDSAGTPAGQPMPARSASRSVTPQRAASPARQMRDIPVSPHAHSRVQVPVHVNQAHAVPQNREASFPRSYSETSSDVTHTRSDDAKHHPLCC